MNSIKEVCEKLWDLEDELDLMNVEISGVRVWEIIRFTIFSKITSELGYYGKAHSAPKKDIISQIKKTCMMVSNSFKKNPFSNSINGQTMILDHPRKIKINNEYIDIYSKALLDEMNNEDFFVIEYPYLAKHLSDPREKNRSYMDIFYIYSVLKIPFVIFKFSKDELDLLKRIEEKLHESFRVNMELKKLIYKKIIIFKLKYYFFDLLLKKKMLSDIILVVSYSNIPLIAAAKDNSINVTEIQHGVITDYHFAYNFSDPTKNIKYFPDKLLTFGEYWGRTERFPKQTEIEVYGFPYLNQQLEKYKGTPKKLKQVLFISQGTIGKELSKQALELAQALPDYHFIYKLHPGEYDRWRTEYPDLVGASRLNNLSVIDHNEKSLYSLFAESEYQVGVYSTAIFEGLTLDCKTLLFDMPGIEYMQELIEQGIVEVVQNKEEAVHCLENYEGTQFSKGYFFKDK
ncbi:hypothetical protein [Virgibacillus halodenitrificans]|uniref:hypothetical protein n=1 Tax=Virgibacillus halodenitrificans TaxID=1482 RepID=UPI001F181368|nr:hypothetical protein [Virgibacillus halodenitrificans]